MAWDDVTSYSYTDNHTIKDWGWEFIRRDERYKKEWAQEFSNFGKYSPLYPHLEAGDLSPFTNMGAVNLIDPNDVDTFSILSTNAWKWQLRFYQHPHAKKLVSENHYLVRTLYTGDTDNEERDDTVTIDIEDHTLLVVVDLLKPITSQMDEITKIANDFQNRQDEWQEKNKSNNPKLSQRKSTKISDQKRELWKTYLRCLDAQEAKVQNDVAASEIFPGAAPEPIRKFYDNVSQIKRHANKMYCLWMY